jgi:hypothetical protein
MEGEVMRGHLERVLLNGTQLVADECGPATVDVAEGACWFQYPLRVKGPSGDTGEVLVLGTMFADPSAAARFERASLAPQAARWQPRGVVWPRPTGVVEPLGMAVSVFPVNGLLPTLVDATDPQRFTGTFRAVPVGTGR